MHFLWANIKVTPNKAVYKMINQRADTLLQVACLLLAYSAGTYAVCAAGYLAKNQLPAATAG